MHGQEERSTDLHMFPSDLEKAYNMVPIENLGGFRKGTDYS